VPISTTGRLVDITSSESRTDRLRASNPPFSHHLGPAARLNPERRGAPEERRLRRRELDGHVTPERVEEEAEQLRPQELLACLATGAEVSFDCSLSLLTQRWGRLSPLGDKRFFCAFGLQCRSV